MNSPLFQMALSPCDCSLTAVCADARLCEQLLLLPTSARARSHTLPDLISHITHCPERSATLQTANVEKLEQYIGC
jgi:hypothetical protein